MPQSKSRSSAGRKASEPHPVGPSADLEEIVSDIGPKVAGLRKAQKLSLQQLAAKSDVSAAAIASMKPGAHSGEKQLRHPGEELVFVLSGSARFTVGGQEFLLTEGDSLHWSGDIPHTWENEGDGKAELVWVVLRGN